MSALDALVRAEAAGVAVFLENGKLVAEAGEATASVPPEVIAMLKAVRRDAVHVLECREAATAALAAAPPEDCGAARAVTGIRRWTTCDDEADSHETAHARLVHGPRKSQWAIAVAGLRRFLAEGWGDKAALLGWTATELYRVPRLWSQIHLTGAALMIGEEKVVAVTGNNIIIETGTGSQLKFRRIGKEHLA
jgi:hypothetical protein